MGPPSPLVRLVATPFSETVVVILVYPVSTVPTLLSRFRYHATPAASAGEFVTFYKNKILYSIN